MCRYLSSFLLLLFTVFAYAQQTKEYYENTKVVKAEGNLLNGKRDGLWKSYYYSGGIEAEENFSNNALHILFVRCKNKIHAA